MITVLRSVVSSVRKSLRERRHRRLEARASCRRALLEGRPIVAVTGAAAKTTTVNLLAHLLGGPPRIAFILTRASRDAPA